MFFKTILLIDDDPAINYYHQYIINQLSISEELIVASEIEIAEKALKEMNQKDASELKHSLLFLDVNMPKYTGFEFIDKHKSIFLDLKEKGVTTFILTTSEYLNETEVLEENAIVHRFFQKPLSREKFDLITNLIS